MDKKLWTVLKYTLINNLNLNKMSKGKKNPLIALGILALIILAIIYAYVEMYYNGLAKDEMQLFLVPSFVVLCTIAVTITIVAKAENILFKPKDYDMLASMPIKNKTILTAKFLYLVGLNVYMSFGVILPLLLKLLIMKDIKVPGFIIGLLLSFFIPVIPSIIGFIISMAVSFVSSKVKHPKLLMTILVVVITMALTVVPVVIGTRVKTPEGMTSAKQSEAFFAKVYNPSYLYFNAVKGDIVSGGIFLVINVALAIISIWILSKSYIKIVQKLNENVKKNVYVEKKLKKSSQLMAMYKKELKRLFGTTIYFMNSCIGVVLLLCGAIILLFVKEEGINGILEEVPNFKQNLLLVLMGMMGYLIAMNSTTCSSISLEGKNLWIYKSMPVKEQKIFLSKILVNVSVVLVPMLISVCLIAFRFKLSLLNIFWLVLIPTMLTILISINGLLVNLLFPLTNYKTEVQVVKQSMATFISVFAGLIFMALNMFGIGALTTLIPNINIVCLIIFAEFSLFTFIEYKILNKWGIKRYREIQ